MAAKRGAAGGANCTLSYIKGTGKNAKTLAYRLRAASVAHGVLQISTESHGRTTRAYYPHRRTQAQFQIGFLLLGRTTVVGGTSEYIRFNKWMGDYFRYLLEEDEFAAVAAFPRMTVTIPTRSFMRQGVPLGPLQYGEHVGSALWRQTINFETTYEPGDPGFASSVFDPGNTNKDINERFFYPSSPLQSGNQKPAVYDGVIKTTDIAGGSLGLTATPDPSAVQGAVTSLDAPSNTPAPQQVPTFDTLPSGKRVPL